MFHLQYGAPMAEHAKPWTMLSQSVDARTARLTQWAGE
jgi:hypothetical protein